MSDFAVSNRAWDATITSLGNPPVLQLMEKKSTAAVRRKSVNISAASTANYSTPPPISQAVHQEEIKRCFKSRGFESGLLRASLGIASTFEDCYALIELLRDFLDPANVSRWRQEYNDKGHK